METKNKFCADVYLDNDFVGNAYVDDLPICGKEMTLKVIDEDGDRNVFGIVTSVSFEEGKTEMILNLESAITRMTKGIKFAAFKFYDESIKHCEELVNALKKFYQALKEAQNNGL